MDHLLRTLASVPPASRVLVAGTPPEDAARFLAQLGFDLTVASGAIADLPDDDAAFDWAAVWLEHGDTDALGRIAQIIAPGAWAWVAVSAPDASPEALSTAASGAGLALAEAPEVEGEGAGRFVRGIYRRVDGTTTA